MFMQNKTEKHKTIKNLHKKLGTIHITKYL